MHRILQQTPVSSFDLLAKRLHDGDILPGYRIIYPGGQTIMSFPVHKMRQPAATLKSAVPAPLIRTLLQREAVFIDGPTRI